MQDPPLAPAAALAPPTDPLPPLLPAVPDPLPPLFSSERCFLGIPYDLCRAQLGQQVGSETEFGEFAVDWSAAGVPFPGTD